MVVSLHTFKLKDNISDCLFYSVSEHARFCVEGFYALYINFHSFIHSILKINRNDADLVKMCVGVSYSVCS